MPIVQTSPSDTATTELAERLRGRLLRPVDKGYDEARSIWNAMIDRHPDLIAQCEGLADVRAAVNFARENNLLLSVKGGGHNIAGRAVGEKGLMIDLSQMDAVWVDPEAKTARVEPGVVLNELDHETQAHGLATPVGYNSTTGIAGLTLGGGFGWLSRKYGLTCDNLLSADVVTAQGRLVHASKDENEDLFWGLRGGGGNFGVVTSFEFDLHRVGPEVLAGLIVHPFDDLEPVLKAYREFLADAPKEATVWFIIRPAPPLDFLPKEWHGKMVLVFAPFYPGKIKKGKKVFQPLRDIGSPIADVVAPQPYAAWQKTFDALQPEGARNYWKSHNFVEITDEMIEIFGEYGEKIPTEETEIGMAHIGGAINDVPTGATAYPHRDAEFVMNLHTRWTDPSQDETCIGWARDLHDAMTPHATGGVYVNFVPEGERDPEAVYRGNYDRMVEVKTKWDPENLFRLNHNVKPAQKT